MSIISKEDQVKGLEKEFIADEFIKVMYLLVDIDLEICEEFMKEETRIRIRDVLRQYCFLID